MSARAALLVAALAASAAVPWSATAGAALDPSQAQADVEGARKNGHDAFCREPREPLSRRARALCPHAREIPGCDGFVAACDRAEKKASRPSSRSSSGGGSGATSGGGGSSRGAAPLVIPGVLAALAQGLVWLLVAVLVLAVLVPIARALLRLRSDSKLAEEVPHAPGTPEASAFEQLPTTTDEELLLRRAEELARRGEHAAALQLYLAASLRALDKRGAVRLARDRTNGEYVRACTDAGAKPALRDIVREVDRAQFGGESPTPEGVSRAAQRAVAIVRTLPAMLLALLVACLVAGCGGAGAGGSGGGGDDPAGDELLYDVLRRQGIEVDPLATSLASLPMPKPGERTAAVVVDTERTELDDDTREHLVDWVDAGGVLVLAGDPGRWPGKAGAAPASSKEHTIAVRHLLAGGTLGAGAANDDEAPVFSETTVKGELTTGDALGFSGVTSRVAWFGDAMTYAALSPHGKGVVLGIASDELFTNAGLARPGNAAALVAILSAADRIELRIAQPDDGVAPPSSPIAALSRAGLGLGMVHALVASLLLFLAVGVRLARPRPQAPPLRRAFAEHVEAVGALYARTHSAPHALAAYARFADERLRARMPRGASDVPAFLAMRAGLPLDVCQRVWTRATAAKAGAAPLGDELAVLKELSAVYSAAMDR